MYSNINTRNTVASILIIFQQCLFALVSVIYK